MLTSAVLGGSKLEEGRKKRQTQVCCLNILLILSVKNGDVMRNNSLGLIWGMDSASQFETCISSIFLFDLSSRKLMLKENNYFFHTFSQCPPGNVFFKLLRLSLKASVTRPVCGVHGSGLKRIFTGISNFSRLAEIVEKRN